MKKIVFYRILSGILATFCLILLVLWYLSATEAISLKKQQALDNYNSWSTLYLMTQELQADVKSIDDLKDYALYQNTMLHHAVYDHLSPAFNGESSDTYHFLTIRYDPFTQDLAGETTSIPEQYLQEGFALYLEMTNDLNTLCKEVLDPAEAEERKLALIDNGSATHQTAQARIKSFCEKWDAKLDAFYEKF